ncbi:hypothetical protein RND71_026620 [Anisodus tanguticus]|uniref:Uncharacterized protein n=1 Tax=Anisodus tanguticus TaxID=243964 RepID=A0AAE1RNY6_9SOLA|nr:hypothetical protein RND71_026620 [Anisodus tanguticus]
MVGPYKNPPCLSVGALAYGDVKSTLTPFFLAFPTLPVHPRFRKFVYHHEASKALHLN